MERSRKFQVGRKLVKVWRWVRCRGITSRSQKKISSSVCRISKTVISFHKWSSSLHQRVRVLCSANTDPSYVRLGQEQRRVDTEETVPKGHLAVYVGESKDERYRVMVPVKYFNHPLFGALLEETEKAFGHDHAGGIRIPCPVYKFENVKMRIASATATHGR